MLFSSYPLSAPKNDVLHQDSRPNSPPWNPGQPGWGSLSQGTMIFVMTNYRVSESLLNPGPQGTVDHTAQYGRAAQVRPSTRAPTATETIPASSSAAVWKLCWKPHSSRPHPGATGAEYNRLTEGHRWSHIHLGTWTWSSIQFLHPELSQVVVLQPDYTINSLNSSPQPFWHQGPVLWKVAFLQTGVGDGLGSALHLLCTLFLLLSHQFHLRSSGIRSWRLGTPGFKGIFIFWRSGLPTRTVWKKLTMSS